MSGYGKLYTLVICLGRLWAFKIHSNFEYQIIRKKIIKKLQSSWRLSSYTRKFCTTLYHSKFGVGSLKRLVMGTSTLHHLDRIMNGYDARSGSHGTWCQAYLHHNILTTTKCQNNHGHYNATPFTKIWMIVLVVPNPFNGCGRINMCQILAQ